MLVPSKSGFNKLGTRMGKTMLRKRAFKGQSGSKVELFQAESFEADYKFSKKGSKDAPTYTVIPV